MRSKFKEYKNNLLKELNNENTYKKMTKKLIMEFLKEKNKELLKSDFKISFSEIINYLDTIIKENKLSKVQLYLFIGKIIEKIINIK